MAFYLASVLVYTVTHVLGASYADVHVLEQLAVTARIGMFFWVLAEALVVVAVGDLHIVNSVLAVGVGNSFVVARVFGQGVVGELVQAGRAAKLDEFYA